METFCHTFHAFLDFTPRSMLLWLPRLVERCPFSIRLYLLIGPVVLAMSMLSGCNDDLTAPDDVSSDAKQRVEDNLLPVLTDESDVVLRSILNVFAALPEFCTQPLAELGSFTSSLPALQRAQQQLGDTIRFDEVDGSWNVTWRDVVLGDDDGLLTVDTDTRSVDLTLSIFFLNFNGVTLQAVPFTLAPQSTLRTAGESPECTTDTNEGFFLVQDAMTSEWTLSWCAQGDTKVFQGTITASTVTRVVRSRSDEAQNVVASLSVGSSTTRITFSEATAPMEDKGIRFFTQPGGTVRFELNLGPDSSNLEDITAEQLRIGPLQLLPVGLAPGDFDLVSNLPFDPTGEPTLGEPTSEDDPPCRPTSEDDLRTLIWQDVDNNQCLPGQEDQWRLRFSTATSSTTFSGIVTGQDDGADVSLRVTPVGACPAGNIESNNTRLSYTCSLQDDTESGYDICVTTGRRVTFSPEVDEVPDPGLVSIGSEGACPPSPDPFTIFFDIELEEQQSSRALRFVRSSLLLRGNGNDEAVPLLNPDQVSFDPLCRLPNEQAQPRVRLTGLGVYSTDRFEGSEYDIEDAEGNSSEVAFTTPNVESLADTRRFPDGGEIRLRTRLDGEEAEIAVRMADITDLGEIPVEVQINVNEVSFPFSNQVLDLTVE